ncbi:MAG TPA: L,D-transpeptidase family protein, partial [Ferruginibacter sp.]|nr:L,D-transpeptidase family protein [Ferruginibacter sp.]
MKKFIIPACILLCIALSCTSKKENKNPIIKTLEAATVIGNFNAQNQHYFDSTAIAVFLDSFPLFSDIKLDINTFYTGRNFSYAWFNNNGMIEQAGNLYNRIKNISEEGIDTSKLVYQQQLSDYMENPLESVEDSLALTAELMLTSQYIYYAKTVWVGLKEKETLAMEWLLPRKKISYTQTLDSLISGKDVLENPPVYKQYYLLKDFLKKYKIAEHADTVKIITKEKSFKKGDTAVIIAQIRNKLFLLGDVEKNSDNNYFDESLELAVKKFQKRVGLKATGVIKKSELDELNIPLHKRIEQILVNMERCRWVPNTITNNYLIVNIPEFKLHAIDNDSLIWSMNVVVGKNQHKTVVFNGTIKYVVFSTYWNIPYSIMKNETLPGLRRNPNYLKKHNMEWNGNSIRQKPGPN